MGVTRRRVWQVMAAAGLPMAARAADGDIVVGQIGPFTGIPVPDAPQLNQGIKAAFQLLNERGGVQGRRLTVFEIDDTYTADGFVKAWKEAASRKPVAFLTPVGSTALKRMLDDKLLDQTDVLVINAVPGAEPFREPGHPRLFHIRAGDKQQIEKLVQHAQTLGVTEITVLHQDIPIGTAGLAMTQAAAKKYGNLGVKAFMARAEPASLAEAAAKVAAAGAKAVLVLGAPRFMADGVAELRKKETGQFVFALSYVPAGLLAKVAGAGSRGVGLSQTYPNPMGVSLPLQREFQAAMKQAFPDVKAYTSFHLEGYISARVFAEAARRSKDITADGVARALRAMGEHDMGGFRVNFAKSNLGSSFVDIAVVTGEGRLMY